MGRTQSRTETTPGAHRDFQYLYDYSLLADEFARRLAKQETAYKR